MVVVAKSMDFETSEVGLNRGYVMYWLIWKKFISFVYYEESNSIYHMGLL